METNVTKAHCIGEPIFFRAARGQGVTFAVLTHESRALTEDKQKTATAPTTESLSSKLPPTMAGDAAE